MTQSVSKRKRKEEEEEEEKQKEEKKENEKDSVTFELSAYEDCITDRIVRECFRKNELANEDSKLVANVGRPRDVGS